MSRAWIRKVVDYGYGRSSTINIALYELMTRLLMTHTLRCIFGLNDYDSRSQKLLTVSDSGSIHFTHRDHAFVRSPSSWYSDISVLISTSFIAPDPLCKNGFSGSLEISQVAYWESPRYYSRTECRRWKVQSDLSCKVRCHGRQRPPTSTSSRCSTRGTRQLKLSPSLSKLSAKTCFVCDKQNEELANESSARPGGASYVHKGRRWFQSDIKFIYVIR